MLIIKQYFVCPVRCVACWAGYVHWNQPSRVTSVRKEYFFSSFTACHLFTFSFFTPYASRVLRNEYSLHVRYLPFFFLCVARLTQRIFPLRLSLYQLYKYPSYSYTSIFLRNKYLSFPNSLRHIFSFPYMLCVTYFSRDDYSF